MTDWEEGQIEPLFVVEHVLVEILRLHLYHQRVGVGEEQMHLDAVPHLFTQN